MALQRYGRAVGMSAAALIAVAAVWLVFSWSSASASSGARTIRVVVPTAKVQFAEGKEVNFRSSYVPKGSSPIVRQDSFGIGTFSGEGLFYGAITLHGGQVVYGGATSNQDAFSYAILGGSGSFTGARGTVTLHPVSQTRVAVTIRVT